MKKYKNIFGTICGFAIGTIIASITATYAATTLSSKNVYYDNTTSGGSSTNVSGAIDELYATADDQDILMAKIIDKIYPIGSIYISTTDSSVEAVESKFGGEWEKYSKGRTLVGDDGTTYIGNPENAKNTGGATTATISYTPKGTISSYSGISGATVLTIEQIPAHTHMQNFTATAGANTNIYIGGLTNQIWTAESVAPQMTNITTAATGGSQGHTHTIDHSHTFTGTKENLNINVQDPYTVVYMYKRIN